MHILSGGVVDRASTRVEEIQTHASAAFVPLRITPVAETAGFRSRFRGLRINDVVVTRIRCTGTEVRRDEALAGSHTPRMLKVALHEHGRGYVTQAGRECAVAAGDLVAYETGRPYQLRFPDSYETVVVGVPWSALGPHAELLGDRTARAVPASEGVRPLVATLLSGLTDLGPGLDGAPAAPHLVDALVSLVVSTFADVTPERCATGGDITDQILAHCQANLHDPNLSLASVASACGVSVSFVQKRLRARGITLGSWIRRQRLGRIRRDLRDPALARRSTAAIAARWGFLDAAHLGRALRAEYGMTASEIREAAANQPAAT